jgi:anaerobic selenocysteine-containing dehydrogenase
MVTVGEERTLKTTCRICRRECGLLVQVRDNRVVRIRGNPEYPVNKGKVCEKVLAFKDVLYHPRRLLYPMRRVGERGENKWQRISWDDAIDIMAERLTRLKESEGPQALGYNTGDELDEGVVFHRRFYNLYGSPNISSSWGLCYASKAMAWRYTFGTVIYADRTNTKCIVLWGVNPAASYYDAGDHAAWGMGPILEAKKRGAKLIVIDPRRSEAAAKADMWVPIRPGTDLALALGMLNVIVNENLYDQDFVSQWTDGFNELKEHLARYSLEEVERITWVPVETIRQVARLFATSKPATLETFEGTDHKVNSVQTNRAFAILQAITGNLDIEGGEVLFQPAFKLKVAGLNLAEALPKEVKPIGAEEHPIFYEFHGEAVPSLFPRAILEGKPYPMRAMIVEGGNPAMIWPNTARSLEALKKLDFLVSFDLFISETGELADLVLPGATFLERANLTTRYSPRFLAARQPVIEPLGEAWPQWRLWFTLARKMGLGAHFPWKDIEEAIDMVLEPTGISFADLKEKGFIVSPSPVPLRKYEVRGFNTPSKKVEIYSRRYEEAGQEPLPTYKESPFYEGYISGKYPLALTTHRRSGHYNTWLHVGTLENYLEIHPEDAKARGVRDGDLVEVQTHMGAMRLRAKVTDGIAKGVVSTPMGFGGWAAWKKEQMASAGESATGNINMLTDETARDPISSAPAFRHTFCQVKKVETA